SREGHLARAQLQRQQIISHGTLRRQSEHKENHQRAVHGQEREKSFRRDLAEQRHLAARPSEMPAHGTRQRASDNRGQQRKKKILQADHLVIAAEKVPSSPRALLRKLESLLRLHLTALRA